MSRHIRFAVLTCFGVLLFQSLAVARSVEQPKDDGKCPNVSGVYSEIGNGIFDSGKTYPAHLMGNSFADRHLRSFSRDELERIAVRITESAPTSMHLEAMLGDRALGEAHLGGSVGWYCSAMRVVRFSSERFAIEAGFGAKVELETIYLSPSDQLCIAHNWQMNYIAGGPARESGYSFVECYGKMVSGSFDSFPKANAH